MLDKHFDCGSVKRDDLHLRLKYFGLKTKIYLIESCHYAIQILNHHDMYDEIKVDFDRNIRRIASWVELVKEKPVKIIEEIEPITNVAYKNEGVFLTRQMFESLLVSRFPNVNFQSIKVEHEGGVIAKILVNDAENEEIFEEIKQFIMDMKLGYTEVNVMNVKTDHRGIYIADVGIACTDKRYEFSVEDSEFWFSNVEKIYSGEMTQESLRFFEPNKTKCFLDFSVWENQNINIRSNILLYDTVYISFPLDMHLNSFLEQQHLSMKDLQTMVERNKLVILLPNTENRYDEKLIKDLHHINRNSVVSKRGINALMAMYYCQLEKQYMSFWKGHEDELASFCMDCVKTKDDQMKIVSDILLWPIRAKIESYELLTSYSPLKLANIGVNRLFEAMPLIQEKKEDIIFELTVNSGSIHLASALQATYFPFYSGSSGALYTDEQVSNIFASTLNAYQYWGKNQRQCINAYAEILGKERNAIYLLKPENNVNLTHILDYAERYDTSHTLRNILQNLVELGEDERKEKIKEYSNLIAEAGKEKFGVGKILNYVLSFTGFIPQVGTYTSIMGLLLQCLEDLGLMEKVILNRLADNRSQMKDEVYLLDRLSRVARIE